jgi:A/G-specific adenine glycosylase
LRSTRGDNVLKSEYRNPKQIRNPKYRTPITKAAVSLGRGFRIFRAAMMGRLSDDAVDSLVASRRSLVRRLRAWFRRQARSLPWRDSRDPYAIWVSEIMLQQTLVATVVSYFARFMRALPTIAALAAASEQEVLRLWAGLGYYRRARDLHRAARILCAEHQGAFPKDVDALRRLPGFGRYTVGAVLSQAFDLPLPIVEANSQRVLCRLLGYGGDPRRGPGKRLVWNTAAALVPRRGAGEFNQALMELGALVCTPQKPKCAICPLTGCCAARRSGRQDAIPLTAAEPRLEQVAEAAVVVRRGRRMLLVQRPDKGRWAGMWEFPHTPLAAGEDHAAAATRLLELLGIRAALREEVTTIRHGVTRFRITMVCLEAVYRAGRFASSLYQSAKWTTLPQLDDIPVSSPQRRLIVALTGRRQRRLF